MSDYEYPSVSQSDTTGTFCDVWCFCGYEFIFNKMFALFAIPFISFGSIICITICHLADCLTHERQHGKRLLNWWTEHDIWLEEKYDWQQHMRDVS